MSEANNFGGEKEQTIHEVEKASTIEDKVSGLVDKLNSIENLSPERKQEIDRLLNIFKENPSPKIGKTVIATIQSIIISLEHPNFRKDLLNATIEDIDRVLERLKRYSQKQ